MLRTGEIMEALDKPYCRVLVISSSPLPEDPFEMVENYMNELMKVKPM